MLETPEAWIERLGLQPLPVEGGYFRETFRSDEVLTADKLPVRYQTPRNLYTSIYYVLTSDTMSALHRLQTDEIYTFIAGDPVTMLQLFDTGTGRTVRLHNTGAADVEAQVQVPRRVWQGSRLEPGGRFAVMSTVCVPGYDLIDFEAGRRAALLETYPKFREQIEALTPASP